LIASTISYLLEPLVCHSICPRTKGNNTKSHHQGYLLGSVRQQERKTIKPFRCQDATLLFETYLVLRWTKKEKKEVSK
jgi:hypothetical protein